MLRRILILSVILSFAISTTGFTYTIVNCKMAKKTARKCLMCKKHMKDKGKYAYALSSSKRCCAITVISKKINDSFVNLVSNSVPGSFICILNDNIKHQYDFYSERKDFSDTSPPVNSNSLYLQNSVLLI